jgi:hypothetical protein
MYHGIFILQAVRARRRRRAVFARRNASTAGGVKASRFYKI